MLVKTEVYVHFSRNWIRIILVKVVRKSYCENPISGLHINYKLDNLLLLSNLRINYLTNFINSVTCRKRFIIQEFFFNDFKRSKNQFIFRVILFLRLTWWNQDQTRIIQDQTLIIRVVLGLFCFFVYWNESVLINRIFVFLVSILTITLGNFTYFFFSLSVWTYMFT